MPKFLLRRPVGFTVALALLSAVVGCGDAASASSCEQYADKLRATLAADLALQSPEAAPLLDYAVEQGRLGCVEEMNQDEVDCVLAGKSACFDEHRPWWKKLKYQVEELTD